jgi:hypothetical protein
MRWKLPVPLQASRELVGLGGLGLKVLADFVIVKLLKLLPSINRKELHICVIGLPWQNEF